MLAIATAATRAAVFVGSAFRGPSNEERDKMSAGSRRLASTLNLVDGIGHAGEAILAVTTGGAFDLIALGYGAAKYGLSFGMGMIGMTTLSQAFHRSGKLTISAASISLVTGGVARFIPAGSLASMMGAAPAFAHGTAALVAGKNVARYEDKI